MSAALAVAPTRKTLAEERIVAQNELWRLIPEQFRVETNIIHVPGCVSVALGGFTVNQLQTLAAILRSMAHV
jgi:hypothetical protein